MLAPASTGRFCAPLHHFRFLALKSPCSEQGAFHSPNSPGRTEAVSCQLQVPLMVVQVIDLTSSSIQPSQSSSNEDSS